MKNRKNLLAYDVDIGQTPRDEDLIFAKNPNPNSEQFYINQQNSLFNMTKQVYKKLSIMAMMLFAIVSANAQSLTCNDGLNVSVDTLCDVSFNQAMFLQGTTPAGLQIFITDGAAVGILPTTNLAGTTVSLNNIMKGMSTFTYELRNPLDGNKCWGFVTFEDKLPPRVTAKNDTIVCTRFANVLDSLRKGLGPITGVSVPVVSDSCQIATQPVMSITTGGADCTGKTITRTWIGATDKFGNLSVPASATILFTPLLIDSVKAPDSVVTINACSLTDAELIPEAIAAIVTARDSRGFPTVGGVRVTQACNLIATYDDVFKSSLCGGGRKIIREWTVLDWCKTGLVTRKFSQIIKVEDKVAPVFGGSTLINNTFDADPWTCGISVRITGNATDNCGAVSYTYISNNPNVVITDGNLLTASMSAGTPIPNTVNGVAYNAGITVIATDACGNTSTRNGTINIFDRAAPVIILKEKLVLNLTSNSNIPGQARAKVFATNIDNGTYDLCGLAKVEVRRRGAVPAGCDESVAATATTPRIFGNSDWRQFVTFCCEDANTRQVVEFLATDKFGNTAISWAEVLVEAKSAAEVRCAPVTVNCDADIAMSTTAVALPASGNGRLGFAGISGDVLCTNEAVTYQDAPSLDGCNVGRVVRTFRLAAGTSQNSCTAVITVNRAPNTAITLLYRPNTTITTVNTTTTQNTVSTTITTCNLTQANIDSRKPTIQTTQGSCDIFGENVEIKLFNIEAGVCKKWAVTYNFINWCNGAQRSHIEYFSYADNTNPVVVSPDVMFEAGNNASGGSGADASGCTGTAVLSATANDANSCDAVAWIKWSAAVDIDGNGTIDYITVNPSDKVLQSQVSTTTGNTLINATSWRVMNATVRAELAARQINLATPALIAVSPNTAVGGTTTLLPITGILNSMNNHTVVWTANDGCNNVGKATTTFMVTDKKAPTPYCVSLSTALMRDPDGTGPRTAMVEIWAKDFDKGSFDNCTSASALYFTFEGTNPVLSNGAPVARDHYFTGAGVESTQAEYEAGRAYVWRTATNTAGVIYTTEGTKNVKMTVWDAKLNKEFCEVTLNVKKADGLVGGTLETMRANGIGKVNVKVDADVAEFPKFGTFDAKYNFVGLASGTYTVTPSKSDNVNNGISTLDLVVMQRHILGSAKLSSPELLIAADVNRDGKINIVDLSEVRKVILGVSEKFSNNDSWTFIPTNHVFADANNPYNAPRSLTLNVTENIDNASFYGIKNGDVTRDAVAAATSSNATPRTSKTVRFTAEDKAVNAGDVVSVDVTAENYNSVVGYQMAANLKGLELVEVKNGAIDMTDAVSAKANTVSVSMVSDKAVSTTSSEVLFTLVFKASANGQLSNMVSLSSAINAEAYDANLEVAKAELSIRSKNAAGFALLQNEPNPFKATTTISFEAPVATKATVTLTDVTGKVINVKNIDAVKGINKVEYNRNDVPAAGVVYYTVSAGEFTATKAMIVVE
jgi:hypothetical protein